MSQIYVVAVYDCNMAYGGPEEGGWWWYDTGCLVRVLNVFRNEDKAYDYCRKLNSKLKSRVYGPNQGKREYSSVLSDGEYRAEVHEGMAPAGYPNGQPHYE